MKDVFDKAKSAVKQTVDTAKQDVSSGGVKALLTKKNIIIAVVAAVIVIGGLSLIFGGGGGGSGGGGDNRLVGRWETGEEDWRMTIQFHRNGMYELWDAGGNLIEQGSWMTFQPETAFGRQDALAFWNRVNLDDPNARWQPYQGTPPDGNGGRTRVWISDLRSGEYSVSGNTARFQSPRIHGGNSRLQWTRIR